MLRGIIVFFAVVLAAYDLELFIFVAFLVIALLSALARLTQKPASSSLPLKRLGEALAKSSRP